MREEGGGGGYRVIEAINVVIKGEGWVWWVFLFAGYIYMVSLVRRGWFLKNLSDVYFFFCDGFCPRLVGCFGKKKKLFKHFIGEGIR